MRVVASTPNSKPVPGAIRGVGPLLPAATVILCQDRPGRAPARAATLSWRAPAHTCWLPLTARTYGRPSSSSHRRRPRSLP